MPSSTTNSPAARRARQSADAVEVPNTAPPPYPGDNTYDLTPLPHTVNRPRLPEDRRNPHLSHVPVDTAIVKFQTIVREGKEIIIGRIKVSTPGENQHAFILRRYDTNAISLSTMFRVAFPGASPAEEEREIDWVNSTFDTSGTNGNSGGRNFVKLAGEWVDRRTAIHLAPAYGLKDLVATLARAEPDPSVKYRMSQRSQAAAEDLQRKKEAQATGTGSGSRAVPSMSATDAAQPSPKRARQAPRAEGTPRRLTLEATTTVTAPPNATIDMNAEIESAKQLVRDLKRELQLRQAAGEDIEEAGSSERGIKRLPDDDGVTISSGQGKGGERVIRTNRRVQQGGVAQAVKTAAYGTMLFGLGVSAALFLPQLASNFM
ncbi:hypothetical protein A1Q2_03803 [Trichosporon asahii var. asahii CBS 8904]|uniref:HTH APSES-type domain-containing protein n=1 Tax=Trichosporon asahii var. asahii (strain CBS 8904) TaxID=1220162 RepID=K1VME5_TRIAC|nr:hypothetical protein A1Q2_03803 [Trichosporon asahii var. asahii CBS 8904]